MRNDNRSIRVVTLLAISAAVLALVAAPTHAQDAPVVADVRFEGLVSVTQAYAQSVVRTSPTDRLDLAVVQADADRLLATARFASVEYHLDDGADGVAVVFVVQERPRLTDLRFVGNEKFSDNKLRGMVPVTVGEIYDSFRVREGRDAIVAAYRDAGYGQVTATYDEQLLRSTGELLYTIEEGPRIRIRKIVFEGAASLPHAELHKRITTKTYIWVFRDGKFDEDAVEADAATLQNYYRDQGFLDARVSYRLDFDEAQRDLTVTFSFVEGARYSVESLAFEGVTVFQESELTELLSVTIGDPVRQILVTRSVSALRDKYGSNGYIHARIQPVRVFSETPEFVHLTFRIDEGSQFEVGRIVVRGNERTQDKVVRRELELFPEEILDATKLRDGENSLRQTRLFDTVSVAAVGDDPRVRDVLISVEEAKKAGDFIFGFGVTSNSGVVGSIVLDVRNFDLFDTPRTFEEFIKLRSFYGAGQHLRIEAQPGTELSRLRVDFTEPYLFDKPLRFDLSGYFFERERDTYNERRLGGNVSLGKRLKKGFLEGWYGELALRIENVKIDDLDLWAPRDVRDDEGSTFLSSVKASLVRDRTDSRFIPTRGERIRLSYEQFGIFGGEVFGKLSAGYTRHFTLRTDELERKSVLSMKGIGGFVVGDAPVFERFYAGGIGSIRGFQFRGVSPRQGVKDVAVGGDMLLLFSTEYSFPLYGDTLRGLLFTDMGTVEEGFELTNWRVAVGGGIRLQVDFFGPVPLEFDVAVPVFSDEDDEEQVFSFFIGATF